MQIPQTEQVYLSFKRQFLRRLWDAERFIRVRIDIELFTDNEHIPFNDHIRNTANQVRMSPRLNWSFSSLLLLYTIIYIEVLTTINISICIIICSIVGFAKKENAYVLIVGQYIESNPV